MIVVFLILVKRVDHSIKCGIEKDMKEFGMQKEMFAAQLEKLDNLWFVMRYMLGIQIYLLMFNFITYINAFLLIDRGDKKICNVIVGNIWVDGTLWCIKQLFSNSLWQYPIIYIFWPRIIKPKRIKAINQTILA